MTFLYGSAELADASSSGFNIDGQKFFAVRRGIRSISTATSTIAWGLTG